MLLCSCDRNSKLMSKNVRQLFLPVYVCASRQRCANAWTMDGRTDEMVGRSRTVLGQVLECPIIDEMVEEGAVGRNHHLCSQTKRSGVSALGVSWLSLVLELSNGA
jgi:hypothetical protein